MTKRRFRRLATPGVMIVLVAAAAAPAQDKAADKQAETGPVTVLDGSSVWRALYSWRAPLAKTADGRKEIQAGRQRGSMIPPGAGDTSSASTITANWTAAPEVARPASTSGR